MTKLIIQQTRGVHKRGGAPGDEPRRASIERLHLHYGAEQLERVFTPFVQGDASLTRRFGGTGLGLALSQHLARLMGGGVSVTSAERRGTTFTVELPAEAPVPRPS